MKSRIRRYFRKLLPAYVNGSLGLVNRLLCLAWLRLDGEGQGELHWLQQMQQGMQSQENREAPIRVLESARSQILLENASESRSKNAAASGRGFPRLAWLAPLAIIIVAVVAIWYLMPPAVILEWSVQGELPSEFRIYRAHIAGSDEPEAAEYELLNRLPAESVEQAYSFSDIQLVPGQRYLYRVEAVDSSGGIVRSSAVSGSAASALPAQLVSLAGALILLYVLVPALSSIFRPANFGGGGHGMVL